MNLLMRDQLGLLRCFEATQCTLITFVGVVREHVLVEIALITAPMWTLVTRIRFLAGMSPHVSFEITGPIRLVGAHRALLRDESSSIG